jgi:hypothetical protein
MISRPPSGAESCNIVVETDLRQPATWEVVSLSSSCIKGGYAITYICIAAIEFGCICCSEGVGNDRSGKLWPSS